MKHKAICRVTSIVLAVVLVLCPLSSCFATEGIVISLVGDEIITVIWETLKAWGINVVESGISEITSNIKQWLMGQLYEYLQDELHESFDSWITGMQFIRDSFGRLIGNQEYINAVDEFAHHLKIAFNLVDNSSTGIDVVHYVDNIELHEFPVYGWSHTRRGEGASIVKYSSNNSNSVYAVLVSDNGYGDSLIVVSPFTWQSFNIDIQFQDESGYVFTAGVSANNNTKYFTLTQGTYAGTYNTTLWYSTKIYESSANNYTYFDGNTYLPSTISLVLSEQSTIQDEGLIIDTDTILYPSIDPNYVNGYSIIYYPDGSIGYIDINWPDTITVDNLPAVISTGSIPNPGFSDVFLPLKAFVNTFSDGMGLMKDIVYHLPTPAVAIFYAIMSITVIFGALHMFKEH